MAGLLAGAPAADPLHTMARATLAPGIAARAYAALDLTGPALAEEPRLAITVPGAPGGARAAHACRTAAAAAAARDASAFVIAGACRVLDRVLARSRRTLRSDGISPASAGTITDAVPSTGSRGVLLAVVAWVLAGDHRRTGPLRTGSAAGEAALHASSVATVPAGAIPGRTSSPGLATLTLGERWGVGCIDQQWHVFAAGGVSRSIVRRCALCAPVRRPPRVRVVTHHDRGVREIDAATCQGEEDHSPGGTTEADPRPQCIIGSDHERSCHPLPHR